MWKDRNEVMFDMVTRDALLIWDGRLFKLEGPFESSENAGVAADELKRRLAEEQSAP